MEDYIYKNENKIKRKKKNWRKKNRNGKDYFNL